MILVEFRCKTPGCGRLLDAIAEPLPAGTLLSYRVSLCPRHGGSVENWRRLGRPGRVLAVTLPQHRTVPYATLAPLMRRARDTGRTQTHRL